MLRNNSLKKLFKLVHTIHQVLLDLCIKSNLIEEKNILQGGLSFSLLNSVKFKLM